MLEGGQVTRTRWAHHVTATSLSVLQRAAYQQYIDKHLADDALPIFREWYKTQSEVHPQFMYWSTTISFTQFVRSRREGRQLPAVSREEPKVGPWFFAMDRTHYSMWAIPNKRHDPAEGHTSKCLPPVRKRQDTPSRQWH